MIEVKDPMINISQAEYDYLREIRVEVEILSRFMERKGNRHYIDTDIICDIFGWEEEEEELAEPGSEPTNEISEAANETNGITNEVKEVKDEVKSNPPATDSPKSRDDQRGKFISAMKKAKIIEYYKENMPQNKIAEKLNVAPSTVHRHLREAGLLNY